MKMKFYDKDPKKGGKEIPMWEFFKRNGLTVNPTHDFDLLVKHRQEIFKKEERFKQGRQSNGLETTDFEINSFTLMWLRNELKIINEVWLSDICPNGKKKSMPSNSDQIEIKKYFDYIEAGIKDTEEKIKQIKIPHFRKDYIDIILCGLKSYFSSEHNEMFKNLLEDKPCSEKLIFKDNGNKLADVFKLLYKEYIISNVCAKDELEIWILENFEYEKIERGEIITKKFKKPYLNKIISGDLKDCMNPIIKKTGTNENGLPIFTFIPKKGTK